MLLVTSLFHAVVVLAGLAMIGEVIRFVEVDAAVIADEACVPTGLPVGITAELKIVRAVGT